MKFILFLLFAISLSAQAQIDACGSYTFKGTPQLKGKQMVLLINEGSRSEMVLTIDPKAAARIAPYLQLMTKGELHLSKVTGPRRAVVSGFAELEHAVLDPVNTTQNSYLQPLKKEKCQ